MPVLNRGIAIVEKLFDDGAAGDHEGSWFSWTRAGLGQEDRLQGNEGLQILGPVVGQLSQHGFPDEDQQV